MASGIRNTPSSLKRAGVIQDIAPQAMHVEEMQRALSMLKHELITHMAELDIKIGHVGFLGAREGQRAPFWLGSLDGGNVEEQEVAPAFSVEL